MFTSYSKQINAYNNETGTWWLSLPNYFKDWFFLTMGPVLALIVLVAIYLFFIQEKRKHNYFWWLPLLLLIIPFLFIPKKNSWYMIMPCVYLIIMAAGAFSEWSHRQTPIARILSSTIVLTLLLSQFFFFTFIFLPRGPAWAMPFPYTNTPLCKTTFCQIEPESITWRTKMMLANIDKTENDARVRHLIVFTGGEIFPIVDFILSGEAPDIAPCSLNEWEKADVFFWIINQENKQEIAVLFNQADREKFNQAVIRDWSLFIESYRELIDLPENTHEIQNVLTNARVQALPTGDYLLYP